MVNLFRKASISEGYTDTLPVKDFSINEPTTFELPFDPGTDKIKKALIEKDGVFPKASISATDNKLTIIPISGFDLNAAYNLIIETSGGKRYLGELITPEFTKFNTDSDVLLKFLADPKKGFNYPYYLWIPGHPNTGANTYMLVEPNNTGTASDDFKLHDIVARNTAQESSWTHKIARNLRVPLLVPVFPRPQSMPKAYIHDLNRDTMLIDDGDLKRVDLQLVAMIKDAQRALKYNGITLNEKVFMNGYSASAKFSNRFAALHPEIVKAVASGGVNACTIIPASTFDRKILRYPVGAADFKELTGSEFNESEYRKVAQFIYMGEKDTNDSTLFRDAYDEEDALLIWDILGKTMMPDRWNELQSVYRQFGFHIQFKTYKGLGHEYNRNIIDDIVDFFNANSGESLHIVND